VTAPDVAFYEQLLIDAASIGSIPNASFKREYFYILLKLCVARRRLQMSSLLARYLGRWALCILFGIVSLVMFMVLVPRGIAEITANRTLAPLILDEYYLTWTRDDAVNLYSALGDAGLKTYRMFYLKLDFWFPVLSLSLFYTALLSLAFPRPNRLAWINVMPIVMWLFDVAENLNHYYMAGIYPDLPALNLLVGPYLTLIKYVLITSLPMVALAGFGLSKLNNRPY
jgi:hypothetical protein